MAEEKSKNPFSDIPPSPTVEVRTLHSDVQSMSASGGTAMRVEDVTEMIGRKAAALPTQSRGERSSILFKLIVLVLVVLIAALVVAFIVSSGIASSVPVLRNFFSSPSSTSGVSSLTTTTTLPGYTPSTSTLNFDPYADIAAQRFFRIDPDASFELTLSRSAAQTAEDLLTYPQRLSLKLEGVPSKARFVELQLKKDGDKPADGLTFMSLSGVRVFNDQFFSDTFEPNVGAFVYRNAQGSWPGYIFKLLPGKNSRSITPQVQLLERSSGLTSLFISSPGPSLGPFTDGVRTGLPTREQAYSLPGATIGYAWEDRYFVISTSADGLVEALRRLLG